jgi:hypothetical protein
VNSVQAPAEETNINNPIMSIDQNPRLALCCPVGRKGLSSPNHNGPVSMMEAIEFESKL